MAAPAPAQTEKTSAAPAAPAVNSGQKTSASKVISDIDEKLKIFTFIKDITIESALLSPYSLTIGSLFLALLTLNVPLAVFGASMSEALLLRIPLNSIFGFLSPPDGQPSQACASRFQLMSPPMLQQLLKSGSQPTNPFSPLYILCAAFSYTFFSMLSFTPELEKLGPSYSNRPYLAVIAGFIFILAFSVYLYANDCFSAASLLIAIATGFLVGYLIMWQNILIAGNDDRSLINLLFIPTLAPNIPSYVCSTVVS
jgi:hypothetical protein